jgi:hypothetical protein
MYGCQLWLPAMVASYGCRLRTPAMVAGYGCRLRTPAMVADCARQLWLLIAHASYGSLLINYIIAKQKSNAFVNIIFG